MQSTGSRLSRGSSLEPEEEIEISSPLCEQILSYPGGKTSDLSDRISELEALGVRSLVPGGRTTIGRLRVCGKGCVGIVVKAVRQSESGAAVCALKIRRTDADRKNMHDEALLHRIANAAGVGPTLRGCTDNFMLMDFVQGPSIMDWSLQATSVESARRVAESVLVQCRYLDRAGIDHGQLSRLDRHVIIPPQTENCSPVIIDFESSSTQRRPANVSAAAQALFIGGRQFIRRISGNGSSGLNDSHTREAIAAIRAYKNSMTDQNFERVLDVLLAGKKSE